MRKRFATVLLAAALAQVAGGSVNRRTPVVEAVEKALPSVVNIGTERMVKVRYSDPARRFRGDLFDQFFSEFFGAAMRPGYEMKHSLGSGVIIDKEGYILTNFHVIERASKIRVTLTDESAYDATFIAGDEINDLALIKIDPLKPLKAVEFAADDDVLLGETVIVLGNPFGLAHSVTVGVLSAKNREASYGGEVLYRDILQTDAAVNPGSSGGPLLNIDGQLIGLNVAIYQEAQNIGFALPVSRVRELLGRWMSPRMLKKLWLGLDVNVQDGVLKVGSIDPDGPAADSGLKAGDIIRKANGVPVAGLYGFNEALLGGNAGDRIVFEVEREGQPVQAEVTLVLLPKPSGEKLAQQRLGLEFGDKKAMAEKKQLVFEKGMPVVAVREKSPAAGVGLRGGLWVTRINEVEINSLDDVGVALENVRSGDLVTLVVLSLDEKETVILAQTSHVQLKAD